MAIIANFIESTEGSPESKIYETFKSAMVFISMVDFNVLALTNILTNVPNLNTSQKLALKLVASNFPKDSSDVSLNNILLFVLYGSFQSVGVSEEELALTILQREAILEQIYLTAKQVIQDKIAELNGLIDWTYEVPNWLPEPEE
jgi:hypothetical protein